MLAAVGLLLNVAARRQRRLGARGRRAPMRDCASSTAAARTGAAPAGAPATGADRLPRVVIAAGGTAGHVVPALAVADALRAEGAEVSFLGARDRAEAELVPAAGYEIDLLGVRGLDRAQPAARRRRRSRSPARARPARARRLLRERGAEAVLGGGGYVAGPAGLAALSLRPAAGADRGRPPPRARPTGCSPGARARVCLAFPIAGRDGERYLVTGRPVPAAIGERRPRRGAGAVRDRRRRPLPARLRRQPGRALDQPRGARGVRRRGRGRARLPRPPHHRRAATTRSPPSGSARRRGRRRYTLLAYEPGLADALAASDLVLARAGRLDLRDRRRRPAGDPGPLPARRRPPPARQRRVDGRRPAPRS